MGKVNERVVVALVGGSDLKKIDEQMNNKALTKFEYVFSENGLVYHRNGELVSSQVRKVSIGVPVSQ